MLSALTVSNCAKNEFEPVPESDNTFSITASLEQTTRTTTDALSGKTSWVAGDKMNVFYTNSSLEAGTYTDCNDFTCSDAESGSFSGTISGTLQESNDWFFFYPYFSGRTTPASTSKGYNEIGCKAGTPMTQSEAGDMSHLYGANLPLYGIAENVANGTTPAVEMKHLASLLEISISNTGATPINVSRIKFSTTNYNVAGTYYVNFTVAPIVLTPSGPSYVAKSAELKITDGTIAAGSIGKFYLPITPFTVAGSVEELTLAVTIDGSIVSKVASASVGTTFASGHKKTLNLSYSAPTPPPPGVKKDYTLTLTKDSFSSASYAANDGENAYQAVADDATTKGFNLTTSKVMQQSSVIQFQKNNGTIYNSEDFGEIHSISITSSAGTFTVYEGSGANPTTSSVTGSDGVYTFSPGMGYFTIKVGSATGKASNITISFTK